MDNLKTKEQESHQAKHTGDNTKASNKRIVIFGFLVLLIIGTAGIAVTKIYMSHNDVNSVPSTLADSVEYQLYFPKKLPDGYYFNESQAEKSGDIVYLTLNSETNDDITISSQFAPKDINIEATLDDSVTDYSDVDAGVYYNISDDKRHMIMVNTNDQTLVFIYSTKNTPIKLLKEIAKNLTKIN